MTMTDLLSVLSPDDVALLRSNYSREFLLTAAANMLPHRKAEGLVGWISSVVFQSNATGTNSLSAAQRELVIISVVATERDSFVLSGHLYWALMEGLSVENIADTLMTVGTYTGVNDFRYSSNVFLAVLGVLQKAVTQGGDALTTPAIVKLLVEMANKLSV